MAGQNDKKKMAVFRVGKPLLCEAWRPACRPTACALLRAEEESGKRFKKSDADFSSCLALREGTPLSAIQGQKKTEKRISEYSNSRHSRFSCLIPTLTKTIHTT